MKILKQSSVEEGDGKVHTSGLLWISNQSHKEELICFPLAASAGLPKAEQAVETEPFFSREWGEWNHVPAQTSGWWVQYENWLLGSFLKGCLGRASIVGLWHCARGSEDCVLVDRVYKVHPSSPDDRI